jgi:multisubunit Na+/H+ antiporter MnhB subunit
MHARQLRSGAAAAAVAAVLVVIAHLAWAWHRHPDSFQRQTLAFHHGIALAIILALVLIAARLAVALEDRGGHPLSDSIGVAGVIAVLAHLAATWRDDGMDVTRALTVVEHVLALLAVAALCLLARRVERVRAE